MMIKGSLLSSALIVKHFRSTLVRQQALSIARSWFSVHSCKAPYFLLCDNYEITACIADLFNSFFVNKCMRLHFSRQCSNCILYQTTIGEVENSIAYVDRLFLSATMKELLKSDSICKSYAQMKKDLVFLTRSVVSVFICTLQQSLILQATVQALLLGLYY